jgi:general secretion pathway protein E
MDMGVEPFLIASSLFAVLAQRLVRTICPICKQPLQASDGALKELGLEEDLILYHGRGCPECMHSGYKGRTGIFELLKMDDDVRSLVTSGADAVTIKATAMGKGMTSLYQDGLSKVKEGITTIDEVLRVTQE